VDFYLYWSGQFKQKVKKIYELKRISKNNINLLNAFAK